MWASRNAPLASALLAVSACSGSCLDGHGSSDGVGPDTGRSDTGPEFEPSRETDAIPLSAASIEISGSEPSGRIWGAVFASDLDGDAASDLVVWGFDDVYGQTVYLFGGDAPREAGPADGISVPVSAVYDDGWMHRPSGSHDLTGDGQADLVVSPGDAYGGVMVASGPIVASVESFPASAWFTGTTADGPQAFATADLNGDDIGDLIVAVHAFDGDAFNGLAVLEGPLDGAYDPSAAQATRSATLELLSSSWLAAGQDLNGDGYEEVVFSDGSFDDGGAAWLFRGPLTGDGVLTDADATFLGTAGRDVVDGPVALAAAIDGGAAGGLLLGSPDSRVLGGWGAAILLYADVTGVQEVDPIARLVGLDRCAATGSAVSFGDVDGDHMPDAVVGSPGLEGGDCLGESNVAITTSPLQGNFWLDGVDYSIGVDATAFGGTVDASMDINVDGRNDLLVGNGYRAWLFVGI
jgi:hypothetical protein